jgi:Xaa-Pro aminopeptidase
LKDFARAYFAYGLLLIGFLHSKVVDDILTQELDKVFFPHGTSHWLGLDVHDAGDYQSVARKSTRRLEEGMVITVEPGIYTQSQAVPRAYRNIGIRIEDDILITEHGPEILSSLAPKEPDEIESLMQSGMF